MAAQIHLLFNHFPIVGIILGTFLGLLSLKFPLLKRGALVILIFAGLLAVPAYFTGEGAEDVLRSSANFPKALIHDHEEWGEKGFIAIVIVSIASAFLLWREVSKPLAQKWYLVLLVASLFVSVLLARVGHLGGLISHPEIRTQSAP